MRDLSDIRVDIDRVDRAIGDLLEERMTLALDVAAYKHSTGKPIYDKAREDAKLDKIRGMASSEFNANALAEIFMQIMSISRRYQYSLIGDNDGYIDNLYTKVDKLPINSKTKIVYQGVPGAFSEQAMMEFFGSDMPNMNVDSFEDVMIALDKGYAEYGILPIENSSAGFVSGIYALLARYDLTIVGEHIVKVDQSLLGVPGATIDDVKTVYSHPQGLLQSKEFLDSHGFEQISLANTAVAAKYVIDENDKTKAAVASARNAELYGLDVINPCINHEKNNSTRFIIVSRHKIYTETSKKIGISFSLAHESGTLYNILAHCIFNGINMTSIESIPLQNKVWEYNFFVTFEGNLGQDNVRNALKGIKEEALAFKILGNY